jgi:cytochrome c1
VHDKPLLLHDGRAKSLEQLLTGKHNPENVAGQRSLTEQELSDLVAFLKSL